MHCLKRVAGFILVLLLLSAQQAAADSIPLQKPENREALSASLKKAEEYCANNLNRFGMNELERYELALDSLYEEEAADTAQAIRTAYEAAHKERIALTSSLLEDIKRLGTEKQEAKENFTALLKKAGMALAVWLVIVVLLVRFRKRATQKAEIKQTANQLQFQTMQEHFEAGKALIQYAVKHRTLAREAKENIAALLKEYENESEQDIETKEKLKAMAAAATVNENLVDAVLAFEDMPESEKTATDLNRLCTISMDAVEHGMTHGKDSFTCVVTKDLEKKLPQALLVPEAVVHLLVCVLKNAFESVEQRHLQGKKGYEPKVSISTRVLPRFLQVRIKDNGEGMSDEAIARISEPFDTTKSHLNASGLGMYFSRQIISDLHKGEMKIESRAGEGTDVYLKFFTS